MNKIPAIKLFSLIRPGILVICSCILFSCNKKEEFVTDTLQDYLPLTVGKYITYRLDSLVFTNFGRNTEIHKHQVKHVIDAEITDNLGRPGYRVFRYLSDSTGTAPWAPAGAYFITPLSDQVEVIDNNFRVIKLHLPVKDGFSWKGNKYLAADSYLPLYDFSNDNDENMQNWDFHFDGVPSSFNYQNIDYQNVQTVEEIDEALNVPIIVPQGYASKSRSVEKYSKGIGLIYRQYELWEYQPNTGGISGPYKVGFGITMWMINHN